MDGFTAQVEIDPTVMDPHHGLVVYRRRPRGMSARRAINDGPVLVSMPTIGSFAQWEAIVSSAISAAGSIGGAAISSALAPHPTTAGAPPPVTTQAQINAAVQAAVRQTSTQTVQTIAGQETTPAHYNVPAQGGMMAQLGGLSTTEIAIGAAALVLIVVLLTRK